MKVSEAEQLVCPFMSNAVTADNDEVNRWKVNCITTKCMAWRMCDSHKDKKDDKNSEGYCQRLSNV